MRSTPYIKAFYILVIGFLAGCGSSSSFFPTSGSGVNPLDCSARVIDYGTKSTGLSRGQYSDIKMVPGTTNSAIAFSDAASLTLKFAYGNGANYTTEVISGDDTIDQVRLGFLSTGTPIVAFGSGTTFLKVAERSAPVSKPGTWSVILLDTVTDVSAIQLAVNPLDQVGISYLTNNDSTGAPRFAYCTSCGSPSGFTVMSAGDSIDASAGATLPVQTGLAWCKANASTYYPAIAYATTAAVKFASCNKSLTSCLSGANWSLQATGGAGAVAANLFIDPAVVGDVPKIVSAAGSGIATYAMGAACTAAPAAFTAGPTLGGAASGLVSLALLKSPPGRFHVVASEAGSSLRYYTSATTTFGGAWNSFGLVDNFNLAAPLSMGAAMDPVGGGLYVSYAVSGGPVDARIAHITDYTLDSNDSSLNVVKVDADATGALQLNALERRQIAMASTSRGIPAVAYVDYSGGTAAKGILKYALRAGNTAASAWNVRPISDGAQPQAPSMVFDAYDRPWISYFDAGYGRFYVTMNSAADGTGPWTTYEFPTIPSGAQQAPPATNETALAISGAKIFFAALDTNAASTGVRVASINAATGQWSTVTVVETLGGFAGESLSMDATAAGSAALYYYDLTMRQAKYAASANGSTWTSPLAITGQGQGMGGRVRINPATGTPLVAYYDRLGNTVYSASCAKSPVACAVSGWAAPLPIDAAVGTSKAASDIDQLLSASLFFDANGIPTVVHPRGVDGGGALAATTIGSSVNYTSLLATGVNATGQGNAPVNYGVAGWEATTTPNAAGLFTTAYIGPGDWLYISSCGD